MTAIFGTEFTAALVAGAARLSSLGPAVDPAWILAIIALESGFDPTVLQGRAKVVLAAGPGDKRPVVAGTNGMRLSHGTGAKGLFQEMPRRSQSPGQADLLALVPDKPPAQQLNEKVDVFYTASVRHKYGGFKSRAALYCANLAPARLIGGDYTDETILYSADPADKPLSSKPNGASTYWPAGYRANAGPFGRDPMDPRGKLRMRDLDSGLAKAVRLNAARYQAELDAVIQLTGGVA